ncbi:MAG: outer membrane protein transport protein [Ancalomicrobiaceae bacterium]|nr:outer membrane protein transport protein [Ancalomicrobiaceae bacterium]
MRRHHARLIGSAAFVVIAAAMVGQASAGGFGIREQSAEGLGTAFAGMAANDTLSAMFWNPATLTSVRGFETSSNLSGILPIVNVNLNRGPLAAQNEGNVGIGVIIPSSYLGYRIDDHWVVGLGINSPFGLMTSYGGGTNLRTYGVAGTSRVVSIDVNPNVAYQINSMVSVAAGLQVQYMELRESAFGPNNSTYAGHTDNLGLGYTLGATFKPMAGTELGIGYRSGITNRIGGTLTILTGPYAGAYGGDLKLKTPGTLSVGLSQAIGDKWTVRAGGEFVNWSTLKSVPVSGPASQIVAGLLGGSTSIPYNYNDSWFFSAGADYKYSDDLTLRAGIGYELSPNDDANRSFRLPDSDRVWLSGGFSYAPAKNYSVDLGYTFIHGFGDKLLSAAQGGPLTNNAFSGTYNANIHILSVAWKIKFGT